MMHLPGSIVKVVNFLIVGIFSCSLIKIKGLTNNFFSRS